MLISWHSVVGSLISLAYSKLGAVIASAVVTHFVTIWAKAKAIEAKAVAELRAKYDAVAEAIRAEAEHDEVIVKATIAKVEADVRKIF